MIDREIAPLLKKYASWFPIVSVTGPRQSGKSTLVQEVFDSYSYVNLELPGERASANDDPLGYIRSHPAPLIIDEAQLAPDLFSVIQVESDRVGTPGQYILSGSQNFLLRRQITQSLAGRVGMLTLLPLSFFELSNDSLKMTFDDYFLKGGYPRLYSSDMPSSVYYRNYVSTYLDRDVSGLVNPTNLSVFNQFLILLASQVGQLLNLASLSSSLAVSSNTLRSWLSILEQSYVIYLLQPYYSNVKKRLTKTPKVYFYDTGLLCSLLSAGSVADLSEDQMLGPVFENAVVAERFKAHANKGVSPALYFYRDSNGVEVDLVDATDRRNVELIEIKSSMTYKSSFLRHLTSVGDELGIDAFHRFVVMRSETASTVNGVSILPVGEWTLFQ